MYHLRLIVSQGLIPDEEFAPFCREMHDAVGRDKSTWLAEGADREPLDLSNFRIDRAGDLLLDLWHEKDATGILLHRRQLARCESIRPSC